jgi:hypothetical protein
MKLADWLSRLYPKGIYAGPVRALFVWSYKNLSIGARIKARVRARLQLGKEDKTPPSLAEGYQLVSVAVALGLLVVADVSPWPVSWIIATAAMYRPLEIVVLTVHWILIDEDKIHSYSRALVLFGGNIVEVVLFFAAAYVALGCVTGPNTAATAVYSSLRTSVTIGPISTLQMPNSACCGGLIAIQIGISYFLAVMVIAHAVGNLRRRESAPKPPAA